MIEDKTDWVKINKMDISIPLNNIIFNLKDSFFLAVSSYLLLLAQFLIGS